MPTSDADCPFCAIAEGGDTRVREVYRDKHVVAFFPTEPATLGHLLLIPRRHVPDLWHLRHEEASQLSRAALYLASAIRHAFSPEGLNVIQSNGQAATQSVPHLHIHIVPRWTGDAMGPIWPDETNYSDQQKDVALRRVRDAVRQTHRSAPFVAPEDRRKHLDYIQAVVTRQSAASSSAKGWLLPIVTATFGFALTQQSWPLAAIGLFSILLFAYLDANYLRSEKRFRSLYNTVAQSRRLVPDFTLDPSDAEDLPTNNIAIKSRWRRFSEAYLPEWDIWRSWSILPFYTALFALGTGVIGLIILRSSK